MRIDLSPLRRRRDEVEGFCVGRKTGMGSHADLALLNPNNQWLKNRCHAASISGLVA